MAADTARPNSESRTPVINDDNDIDKKNTIYMQSLGYESRGEQCGLAL